MEVNAPPVTPGQVQRNREILIAEDEPMVVEVVERYLLREGYAVARAKDGVSAMQRISERLPDLVVLDLMLPGIDGYEICRRIREQSQVPIIMLTARSEEVDRLLGLGLGADDYVTKPFSPRELVARVAAVLRRSEGQGGRNDIVRAGDLRIDVRSRVVEDGVAEIDLTAREFDLLWHLARHPGQVFSREQLLLSVWDIDFAGDSSTVTVHMRRLRAKVERDPSRPKHLKTVWGVGYKFEP